MYGTVEECKAPRYKVLVCLTVHIHRCEMKIIFVEIETEGNGKVIFCLYYSENLIKKFTIQAKYLEKNKENFITIRDMYLP